MVVWLPTRAIGRSENTTIVAEPRYRRQQPGMNEIAPRQHTSKVIFKNPCTIVVSSSKITEKPQQPGRPTAFCSRLSV